MHTMKLIVMVLVAFAVPADGQAVFYNWLQSLLSLKENTDFRRHANDVENDLRWNQNFKIIWSVPTFQCHKYGLNFSEVSGWGITQNYGDTFRGDKIALLYDPGFFPALLDANSYSDPVARNGGVPQEGNLTEHLDIFERQIREKLIPDESFSGVAIIDFEHWRPIWKENFGSLTPYKKFSKEIEQHKHPLWTNSEIEKEASKRFEKSAWQFFRRTLKFAKVLRPNAQWGYYGFPLCFNYTPHNKQSKCSENVKDNNERIKWLFEESTAIYPSLYFKKYSMNENTRVLFMKGRMEEAMRVSHFSASPTPVFPFTWLKYYDTKDFVSKNDLLNSMLVPLKQGATGVIIWGSSNDVNTEKKCFALQNYVNNVLGPVSQYILKSPKDQLEVISEHGNQETDSNSVDYILPS